MNFLMKKLETVKNRKDKGFSLIELIVVVILLGILAAIAIPAYNGIENRAKASVVEVAAANTLKEAIVADSMGSDSSKFQEILDNNSNDDVTVTYHDSSGQRSNVPGNPIVVESWWNDGSTEKFNVIVPAPTTPEDSGGGEVTPPEENNNVHPDFTGMTVMTVMSDTDNFVDHTGSGGYRGPFLNDAPPMAFDGDFWVSENGGTPYQITFPLDLEAGVEYEIAIDGTFNAFRVTNMMGFMGQPIDHVRSLDQWSPNLDSTFTSLSGAFMYQSNFEYVATPPNSITNMSQMFMNATNFNQNIGHWDTSNVTNMSQMFSDARNFNQNINNWDTSTVTNMSNMFYQAEKFNQPLNNWNTSNVTNMKDMFSATSSASAFNQDISDWDVSSVENMSYMFAYNFSFDQPLNNWDVSNVTDMSYMFAGTNFNQPIGNWDTSSVTNMVRMFDNAGSFNQNINSWDTSSVTMMNYMFYRATNFNQPLNNWNVENVTNMFGVFEEALTFNQPLSNWRPVKVQSMDSMFRNATSFDQNISSWPVPLVTNTNAFSYNSPINMKPEFLPNFN